MRHQALAGLLLAMSLSATAADVAVVTIKNYGFPPQNLTVTAGTTIRWINREKRQYHSVWFKELGEPKPDYFFPGESYERVFKKPGTYHYRCGPHPEMTGTIRVVE
jgi:plastocyanin